MRRGVRRAGARVLLLSMIAGSVALWLGLPVAWLWIGSQVQGASGSLGAALGAAMLGFVLCAAMLYLVLSRLSERRRELLVAAGEEDPGHLALEVVMVSSAAVSVVVFAAWFLLFSGSSPVPLGLPS